MRHAIAIAVGLISSVSGLAGAQDAVRTEQIELLKSARAEIESLKRELRTMKEECAGQATSNCLTATSVSPQSVGTQLVGPHLIVKRYRWVPASSVGVIPQFAASTPATSGLTASGVATSGFTTLQAPAVSTLNSFGVSQAPVFVVQSAPLIASGFAPQGFATQGFATQGLSNGFAGGTVGAGSFAPASSNVLPASPYSPHHSYGVYSQPVFTQSLGANGVLGAGLTNTPVYVYPTTQFRGTSGFTNSMPAPYYSVY
ncbi:MAG: hypothetical protein HQ518_04680 [Rhodopirellula sp.]|nr:hypothetical protein [Rhodopirellula sp.]